MDEFEDRQDAIKLLETKRRNIEQQIAKLQTDVEAIRRAVDILADRTTQASLLNATPIVSNELKDYKPTSAILRVLEGQPEKTWTASELAREIKRRGYNSPTKNFASIISSTVFRLAKDKKVEKIEEKGMTTRFKKKEKK